MQCADSSISSFWFLLVCRFHFLYFLNVSHDGVWVGESQVDIALRGCLHLNIEKTFLALVRNTRNRDVHNDTSYSAKTPRYAIKLVMMSP